MTGWALHPRLEADTHAVASLALCDVRLMDDARFPWLALVPRLVDAVEWIDLDREHQHRLADEISLASTALRRVTACDKLNVATLGNVVAQMHVHVVGRRRGDPAWPAPVWGSGAAVPYAGDTRDALLDALRRELR